MKTLLGFVMVSIIAASVLFAQTQQDKNKTAASDTEKAARSNKSKLTSPLVKITPLNVKTGLWQSTSRLIVVGALGAPPSMVAKMTPEQRARFEAAMQAHSGGRTSTFTNKDCLTQKDLTTNPFAGDNNSDEGVHCQGTLVSSTSSDVVLQRTCTGEATLNYTMKIHAVDQEHAIGTGEGTATVGGHTMSSKVRFESKWLGASCPAGAKNNDN